MPCPVITLYVADGGSGKKEKQREEQTDSCRLCLKKGRYRLMQETNEACLNAAICQASALLPASAS
jgi:hypothetical protein